MWVVFPHWHTVTVNRHGHGDRFIEVRTIVANTQLANSQIPTELQLPSNLKTIPNGGQQSAPRTVAAIMPKSNEKN